MGALFSEGSLIVPAPYASKYSSTLNTGFHDFFCNVFCNFNRFTDCFALSDQARNIGRSSYILSVFYHFKVQV